MREAPPPPSHPDWVIIGMRHGDRCILYASRTLSQVQLQFEIDGWCDLPRVTMTLQFHGYVTIIAPTYTECLMRLFTMGEPGQWRDPEQGELHEGPRALGAGG